MSKSAGLVLSIGISVAAFATCMPLQAAPVITNGGFEAGFAGWTRVDQAGGDGSFMIQSGTASPLNGDPVPAPPTGVNAAMTDASGPGSHVLFQDLWPAWRMRLCGLTCSSATVPTALPHRRVSTSH